MLTKAQEKALGEYLKAKSDWGKKWQEIYESEGKNVSLTNNLILDTAEDNELIITKIELKLALGIEPTFS